jgi:ferredoxin
MSDVLRTTAAYQRRRKAHLCVWCGIPAALRPSGVAYAHCAIHRAMDAAKTDRNGRQAKLRHLADGRCYECGSFCSRNPSTGRSFNLCIEHRLSRSVRTNARRANAAPRRVLAALSGVMTMTEIRVAAKMDTRTCLRTMQGLVLAGTVVRTERVTALRGRKGFLYARAAA